MLGGILGHLIGIVEACKLVKFAGPSGVLDPEIDIPNPSTLADLQYAASMPAYSGSKIGS